MCGLTASAALAQAPVMSAPVVSGANVTFTWSATAGAASYVLAATIVPGGPPLAVFNVGNVTSIPVTAPTSGVFYVRVAALPGGQVSNEVQVVVASLVAPPAAPVGLQAYRNGTGVLISWHPGGGAPAAGYILRIGTSPGGSELGVIPTGATGLAVGGGVPPGTYYLSVSAVNTGGRERRGDHRAEHAGRRGLRRAARPGLDDRRLGQFPDRELVGSARRGQLPAERGRPGRQHQRALRRRHHQLPLSRPAARDVELRHPGAVRLRRLRRRRRLGSSPMMGPRCGCSRGHRIRPTTPTSAMPRHHQRRRCGLPGRSEQLVQGARRQQSLAVPRRRALRERDKRWGLNWKRANVGDMSQDVITYNWSTDPDEGTFKLRAYDIIGGHCGSRPGARF